MLEAVRERLQQVLALALLVSRQVGIKRESYWLAGYQ